MPVINNFGDVVTQGNTQIAGNVTVQGTGTSSWTSATSAVTLAGTLAVTGTTTTTGIIIPNVDGVSGIGGPARRYNNVFTANANIYSTANIATANVSNLNVFALATFVGPITVQDTTRLIGATTVTGTIAPTASGVSGLGGPSAYFANAFMKVANIGSTDTVLSLNVLGNTFISNTLNVTNILGVTTNMSFMNVISWMNAATINVYTGANVTTLTVSGLSNLFNANIVSSNLQTTNIQYANVATINVWNGANATTLTVSGLSNQFNSNIITANSESSNIQYANIRSLNVWAGANVTTFTVSGLSNLFNANIVSSNLQTTNIQYANVATINVWNGANVTTLTVSGLSNLFAANIVSSNLQTTNIQYANVATINVTNAMNTTTLTVSGLSNLFAANIVSSNLQTTNIQYANVATINVWNGANVTTLTVSVFQNVNSSNIVTLVNSTLNVSTRANLQVTNIFSGNVISTWNVNGLLTATYLSGNGSALMNLHASNISNGILNFNATNGLGANGIAITGSVGGNGQILASTGGVGAGVQWIGPATGIWSNVVPSITPPPYPIYYSIGNVGVGNTLWTSFGTGFNTYPGAPLDVYGGSGTFSNVSDATYYGTIRIQNNPGTHNAPGGLEFKCGTTGIPGPGGGTGHRLVASELTVGSGVAPLIWQIRSGTRNWSNALTIMCGSAYSGFIGIGTEGPLYQLHIYQSASLSPATLTVQHTGSNQGSYLYLSNSSGTACTLYLNGPGATSDGPANSATLRNDAGDLRLAGRSTKPVVYLDSVSNSVYIGTTTSVLSSNVVVWAPQTAVTGFPMIIAADTNLGRGSPGSNFAGDPGAAQLLLTGSTSTTKRLAFMYDTTNNMGMIQAMIQGTGTSPLMINGAGGNVGVGRTSASYALDVNGYIRSTITSLVGYTNIVNRRPIWGVGSKASAKYLSLAYSTSPVTSSVIAYSYAPFSTSYGNPAVATGATRLFRIYACYNDNATTGTFSLVFNFNTGGTVTFTLPSTFGGADSLYDRDVLTATVADPSNGNHGYWTVVGTPSALAPQGGGVTPFNIYFNYIELQTIDQY